MKVTINKPIDIEAKFLKVDAGVRYWEDSEINGVSDSQVPAIPCAEFIGEQHKILIGQDYRWRPFIDIDSGQIVNWEYGYQANIHYKVCDDGIYTLLDNEHNEIIRVEGYVPSCMCPEDEGYGDYIIMNVDQNGFIQNWDKELINKLVRQREG